VPSNNGLDADLMDEVFKITSNLMRNYSGKKTVFWGWPKFTLKPYWPCFFSEFEKKNPENENGRLISGF